MSILTFEGKRPLLGTVDVYGSKESAIKLMYAAMFSNLDVVLDNIPNLPVVIKEMEILKSIGGKVLNVGTDKYVFNGSEINTYEVPYIEGYNYDSAVLLAGPLLFRFGKAIIPITKTTGVTEIRKSNPINRLVTAWTSLGINFTQDDDNLVLSSDNAQGSYVNFRTTSNLGTTSAILSALFLPGETVISNVSEEPEIEDLIQFCVLLGAEIKREESRRLIIHGTKIFKGGSFEIQSDKVAPFIYACASILTHGNMIIRKINKSALTSMLHFFSNANINYEFSGSELKVWGNESIIEPLNVTIAPSPAFIPAWKPYLTLLQTQANGISLIHDTVYTDRFNFVQDLNRMNAKIELHKPTEVGLIPVISDDSYDFEKSGEPLTVAKVYGPSKLKGQRIHVMDSDYTDMFILAALAAEGRSDILNFDDSNLNVESFLDNLSNLGASIKS